jgi:hypothetical protein
VADKIPDAESAEAVPRFPEKIGPADLETLNRALAALLVELRLARALPAGGTGGRLGAVVALRAAWDFLIHFEPVLAENLHAPLMSLHSALLALNENNVEPILKPTKRTGRATSSPRHQSMIGIAVGAAQRLEWTGLSPAEANKAVASKLNALGIKPTRGKKGVTADTLRRWGEQISATQPLLRSLSQLNPSDFGADAGWINAALNAEAMLSEKWRARLTAVAPAEARRLVLSSLEASIREMALADPAKPPS